MSKIAWKRVERRGSLPSHWEGSAGIGKAWSIWMRVTGGGHARNREVSFVLIPSHRKYPKLKDAKQAAERLSA